MELVWSAEGPSLAPPRLTPAPAPAPRYSVAEALAEYPAVNLSVRRCFIGPRQHPLPTHNQSPLFMASGPESRLRCAADWKIGVIPGTSHWVLLWPVRRMANGPFNFQPLQTLLLDLEAYAVVYAQTNSPSIWNPGPGLENENGKWAHGINEYPSVDELRAKRAEGDPQRKILP